MLYVGETIYILCGIGSGNVFRSLNFLLGVVGGLGVVLDLVGLVGSCDCYFLCGNVPHLKDHAPPLDVGTFYMVFDAFGIGFVGLLSQKTKKN